MIMADVFKILFLILGAIVCTMSYWLLFQALFSETVERSRVAVLTHPWRVFMVGAFVGVPASVIGLAMLSDGAGPVKFVGGAMLVAITTVSLLGSTGLIRHVGAQLSAEATRYSRGVLVLRGGTVGAVACVFPIVGWFFLIPVILIIGFGTALRLFWTRRERAIDPPVMPGSPT